MVKIIDYFDNINVIYWILDNINVIYLCIFLNLWIFLMLREMELSSPCALCVRVASRLSMYN